MNSATDPSLRGYGAAVDDLIHALDALIQQRPIALLDWPFYPNAGDHFIWLAEKFLFRTRLRSKIIYECSHQHVDFSRLVRLPADTIFVMHGGGNFGDLYAHHQRFREAIIAAFHDRRIVIMPQTVFFQSQEQAQHSARRMALHPDLHVIARDRRSLVTLRSRMGLANCSLHIDPTFVLQPVIAALVETFSSVPKYATIGLLRGDIEAGHVKPMPADGVPRFDWMKSDDLAEYAAAAPDIHSISSVGEFLESELDFFSWGRLCAAVRLFGDTNQIITDRLHGHILAIMMGKKHELHDNSYGKNAAFHATWTLSDSLATFVGQVDRDIVAAQARAPDECDRHVSKAVAQQSDSKRLGIIVPYRNRVEQFEKFVPHVISYFRRVGAKKIHDVKIIVAEQDDQLPFNRGGLLNAGFLAIEGMVDYVCFHDIDYLPMWADYAYADRPTRIIWWGMHNRPIRVADPTRRTQAPRRGLGAVALFTNDHFRAVNGYSNRFFGWGFEDKDLAAKCALHSLDIQQRDGTFIPLDHDNAGFLADGSKSPAWIENEQRFAENQRDYARHGTGREGLSSFSADTGSLEYARAAGLDAAEVAEILRIRVRFDRTQASGGDDATNHFFNLTLRGVGEPSDVAAATVQNAGRAPPTRGADRALAVAPVPRRQKICLSMIVKNEAPVILRCLRSVLPLIDYWIIVDTGSIDHTQQTIREFFQDVPGELHERPWVNFAHNRSEALVLARPHGDYSLIIDADDVLELPPGFRLPFLKEDSLTIEIRNRERRYWRPQLLRNNVAWRYEGVLHEFLSCGMDKNSKRIFPEHRSQRRLSGARIVMSEEGARRRLAAADRFRRDAALLESALATETDPFLISRYRFYLAQSYLDAGARHEALEAYQQRAKLGGWDQEVFISHYRAANLKGELGLDDDDVIATYLQAHAVCNSRAEALHGAARFCRSRKLFQRGFDFAKRGLQIRRPDDALFSEIWVYDYGLLDEYAVNAYWIGRYGVCLEACRKLLGSRTTPADQRGRIQANADLAAQKIPVVR